MSKGYLIIAQGNYSGMADLLARSILSTQTVVKDVHIVTGLEGDVMLNRTKVYDLSPFDETVLLDADMLFLSDVSHWWQHLAKFPLLITDKVQNYRGERITESPYRKSFNNNNLPNCYSAFTYFQKDPVSKDFFDLLEDIIRNWYEYTVRYAPNNRQDWPSIDLAMAIALKILGLDAFTPLDYPTFTHMKSGCQGWTTYSEDWRKHLGCYISNGQLRLGNYRQSGILHYVNKNLTNELLRLF